MYPKIIIMYPKCILFIVQTNSMLTEKMIWEQNMP